MRIALIDSTPKDRLYPIALLKISAWRKSLGDETKLFSNCLPEPGEFDEIWINTIFTFDIPHVITLIREAKKRAKKVKVGGISASLLPKYFTDEGVEVHVGLIPEAENVVPDYSILKEKPDYSITYLSRGCVRRCGFCMVPKLEPEYQVRPGWKESLHPDTDKILFYDNNWFAKKKNDLYREIDDLKEFVVTRRIKSVDFNQGLDVRLMSEDLAKRLKGIPFDPVRFAFDGMQEDGFFQRGVEWMVEHAGSKKFGVYTLYNFEDSPADLWYRVREMVKLNEKLGTDIWSFPMRYQPILDVDNGRNYIGKLWTETQRRNVMRLQGSAAVTGQYSFQNLEMFEYWFTDSPEKFAKILSWEKAPEFFHKKRGALRFTRALAKNGKQTEKNDGKI